jgi:hypothetical protein
VQALFNILRNFGEATGLRLNMEKCTVAPIRWSGINLERVLETFTGLQVAFPITYLGLPLTLGRLRIVHVQRVLNKTRSKLSLGKVDY